MRVRTTDDISLTGKKRFLPVEQRNFPFVDSYRAQKSPTVNDLVSEYEGVAYSCANLNARRIGSATLRLFVRNDAGRKQKTFPARSLSISQYEAITRRFKMRLSSKEEIEELTQHPALDLLDNPNSEIDGCQLLFVSQLFKDITGTAFWYVAKDGIGKPSGIFYLKSQFINLVRDGDGNFSHYRYGGGRQAVDYLKDASDYRVINFPAYGLLSDELGYAPLRAAWETVNFNNKLTAQQASIIDNNARPDLVITPKGDGYMGDDEKGRYELRFNQKFQKAGNGGVLFFDEEMNVTPLNFSPKDLSIIQFLDWGKVEVCNAFGVPPAMLDKDVTVANLEAYQKQHVDDAISPRLREIEARLNKFYLPMFDDSGRLFLAFDDPSPQNKEQQQRFLTGYVSANVLTVNEVRQELNYPPHKDGDALFTPMPGLELPTDDEPADDETNETDRDVEPGRDAPEPTATPVETDAIQQQALNGAQVQSLLSIAEQVTAGTLPPESAQGLIAAAFPLLTAEQVTAIIGPLVEFQAAQPADDEGNGGSFPAADEP